jgi:hypothetical protein
MILISRADDYEDSVSLQGRTHHGRGDPRNRVRGCGPRCFSQVRKALDAIPRNLDDQRVSEIEFQDDYSHWDVPRDDCHGVREQPTQRTVGQVADDVNELKRIVSGHVPPYGQGLIWLGAVPGKIGELSSV